MVAQFRRSLLLECLKVFDVITVIAAWLLASLAVQERIQYQGWIQLLSIRAELAEFLLLLLFFWAWHIAFSLMGFYVSQRLASIRREVLQVIKTVALGTAALWLAGQLADSPLLNLRFVVCFFGAANILIISGRLILRAGLVYARLRGRNLRYLVIVGTNSRAVQLARDIDSRPTLGYRIRGFVDDDWKGVGEFRQNGYSLIANLAGFRDYLRHNVVDEVIIELPMKSLYQPASDIFDACIEQGILVGYLPDIFGSNQKRSPVTSFDVEPLGTISVGESDGWGLFLKRLVDVSLSSIAILFLSPLLLVVAILVKVTSPGPVFFVQDRVGLNKRHFRLYKFRTMIFGAEKMQDGLEKYNEMSGPVFKINKDPRVTRVGRFLRKTSIDELPQLFNVLKGDMSLVGPRPLPIRDYSGFEEDWQRRRLSVLPGITCLWQIGGRNGVSFEKWMQMDLQYIDRRSLLLDLTILAKTIPAVFKGTGA